MTAKIERRNDPSSATISRWHNAAWSGCKVYITGDEYRVNLSGGMSSQQLILDREQFDKLFDAMAEATHKRDMEEIERDDFQENQENLDAKREKETQL